jgi:hypothetical protein
MRREVAFFEHDLSFELGDRAEHVEHELAVPDFMRLSIREGLDGIRFRF